MRLAGFAAGRFNDIRIDRPLGKPLDTVEPVRLLIEDRYKFSTDNLAVSLPDPPRHLEPSETVARH